MQDLSYALPNYYRNESFGRTIIREWSKKMNFSEENILLLKLSYIRFASGVKSGLYGTIFFQLKEDLGENDLLDVTLGINREKIFASNKSIGFEETITTISNYVDWLLYKVDNTYSVKLEDYENHIDKKFDILSPN